MDAVLDKARRLLSPCVVCPRKCGVKRLEDERGYCGVGSQALVSTHGAHFGEESVVGRGGSGTIFLAGCNLKCIFCQNYDLSHRHLGKPAEPRAIAQLMITLQEQGCHNVNFVTPSHVMPQLLEAVLLAREAGLTVPVVWNCGGYESVEALELLAGHVEIYMPDAKFADAETAERLAQAPDYFAVMRAAVLEMHRQVGDLAIDDGLARRGLLVRHLVMPGGAKETREILDFLADEVSPRTFVNVMGQYRPEYRATHDRAVGRYPTASEIGEARDYARRKGLRLSD